MEHRCASCGRRVGRPGAVRRHCDWCHQPVCKQKTCLRVVSYTRPAAKSYQKWGFLPFATYAFLLCQACEEGDD